MPTVPTQGRVVLCYNPHSWEGALPGTIIHAWGNTPDCLVNVSVQGDGVNEPFNQSLTSVRVYEADEPQPADQPRCVWPPRAPAPPKQ